MQAAGGRRQAGVAFRSEAVCAVCTEPSRHSSADRYRERSAESYMIRFKGITDHIDRCGLRYGPDFARQNPEIMDSNATGDSLSVSVFCVCAVLRAGRTLRLADSRPRGPLHYV
jgi:hypothetical protein